MKVKFCSHGIVSVEAHGGASVNPAWLFMQKWYELHGLNPDLVWLPPGVFLINVEESIKDIIESQPDILGLGVYVWNDDTQHLIAKKVKEQLPNTVIVLGGPNLTVHKDFENGSDSTDYFKKHPYVDYVVYGDGEKPFQQIIDYHSGYIASKQHFVNIVENYNEQGKCYPYEMINDELYLSQSPYVSQEQHMREMRDRFVDQGIDISKQRWLMEFARGCMYSCTFCDWAQNLSKKVKRRKHDWKPDIDLFYRLNVKIKNIDANFGQWPDDVRAFDYACSLKDPDKNFNFPAINLPKLKKDVCEYLIIKNSLVWGIPPKISIQDPMEDVLTAINRPSVSWERLSEMILNIKAAIPPELFDRTEMETILGLPEQTLDSIAESYLKYYELGIVTANYHPWTILPNSPAADPNYQKLWGIKTKVIYELMSFELAVDSLENLYHRLSQSTANERINFVQMPIVVEHRKMSLIDIMAAKIMSTTWHDFNYKFAVRGKINNDQVRVLFDKLKTNSKQQAAEQYELHKQHINKYNFIVWGKYNPETKKMTRL